MNIFALWGEIEINRKKAETDIKAVEKQAEKSGKKMETSFDKVTKVVATAIKEVDKFGDRVETLGKNLSKKAGVPLAALTALVGGLAKATADYGDRVAKQAQQIGLSVQSYQELEYAMGQNGVSTEEFEMSIGNLNQRLGMARRGNEQYRKTLEQLGFNLDELDKGAISTEESFNQIVAALANMDDAQMQAAIASDFFGTRVARRLIPAIRGGAEGIEELRQRAHDLGLVMDDEFTRRSEKFGDTMDDLSRATGGLGRAIGKELLAPFINLGKWITDIVSGVTGWIEENPKLVRQIIIWGGAIAGVLGVLVTLGTTLMITGKIIGALGVIFNILTSKPVLIIAAIGALYLAWTNDWLGIRTAVEDAWEKIEPIIDAIIEWGQKTISTVWNWAVDAIPAFLTWIKETAWPIINSSASTAWNWTTGTISAFVTWIKETAWPFIDGVATTTWNWSRGKVGDFIAWIKEVAWPFLDGVATTTWNWVEGEAVPAVLQAGKAVINAVVEVSGKVYDAIKKGFETGDWADFWDITSDLWSKGVIIGITLSQSVKGFSAVINAIRRGLGLAAAAGAGLGIPGLIGLLSVGIQLVEAQAEGSYEEFARNVIVAGLASVLGATVGGGPGAMLAFNVAVNLKLGNLTGFELLWDWISYNLEKIFSLKFGEMMSLAEFSKEWAKRKVREEMGIAPDAPSDAEIYTGEKLLLQTIEKQAIKNSARVREQHVGAGIGTSTTLDKLLDAIYKAEGGAKARVPYGMTGFADGIKYRSEIDQARFQELSQGLDVGSEDYWRAAAQTTVEHYWRWFKTRFPELGEKTFDEVGPEIQSMFITFLGSHFSPPGDHELNLNWVPNVLDIVGFKELAEEFRSGGENIMDAWIDAISDKAGDVEAVVDLMAGIVAKYMVGESPPPE
ncbi:MAG TPA: phage tail tape measure protein, partial [Bacillota bacterium]|nr:phage tail tape measure protein [Bacillota bacterium]